MRGRECTQAPAPTASPSRPLLWSRRADRCNWSTRTSRVAECSSRPAIPAVVSSLVGRPKLPGAEPGHGVVPLLLPAEHGLPFAATLDIVSASNPSSNRTCAEYYSITGGDEHNKRPASPVRTMLRRQLPNDHVLELLYILSGEGTLMVQEGSNRQVKPGDSVLAWADSTRLHHAQHTPCSSTISCTDMLAALKFHIPLDLLQPPQIRQRQSEVTMQQGSRAMQETCAEDPMQGHASHMGNIILGAHVDVFTQAECEHVMSTVQVRTDKAISSLYDTVQVRDSEVRLPPEVSLSPQRQPQPESAKRQQQQQQPVLEVPHHSSSLSCHHQQQGQLYAGPFAFSIPHSAALSLPSAPHDLASQLAAFCRIATASLPQTFHSAWAQTLAWTVNQGLVLDWGEKMLAFLADASASAHSSHQQVGTQQQQQQQQHEGEPSGVPSVLLQRAMEEFVAYRFPRQTNKLAFVFDPSELDLPLSFGVEVFQPGHRTPIHVHDTAHELFFVLAGQGDAYCDGEHTPVQAGDVIVFPPGSKHGLDNNTNDKLYCLQLMAPNEQFVEHVKTGTHIGRLDDEDLCNLTNTHC